MNKRSFTWNPEETCIFGSITRPKSECIFDYWSIYHFYFTGFAYIILHHLLKINNLKDAIVLTSILTIIHVIEEYFGNTTKLSLEGIVIDNIGPIFNPRVNPKNRKIDDDYLQNSIGDVLSGVIACLLIIWYWKQYNVLPYNYLWGIIIIFFMLMDKADMLATKN